MAVINPIRPQKLDLEQFNITMNAPTNSIDPKLKISIQIHEIRETQKILTLTEIV